MTAVRARAATRQRKTLPRLHQQDSSEEHERAEIHGAMVRVTLAEEYSFIFSRCDQRVMVNLFLPTLRA